MSAKLTQYFTSEYWIGICRTFGQAIRTWKFWKEFILMTIGMIFGAAAVYYFLMPAKLIVGTISGFCMVLNEIWGGTTYSFSNWMLVVNAILLVMAFVTVGEEFGAKTVYTGLILGPMCSLLEWVYPYTNFTHKVITDAAVQTRLMAGETVLDVHGNPYLLSRS